MAAPMKLLNLRKITLLLRVPRRDKIRLNICKWYHTSKSYDINHVDGISDFRLLSNQMKDTVCRSYASLFSSSRSINDTPYKNYKDLASCHGSSLRGKAMSRNFSTDSVSNKPPDLPGSGGGKSQLRGRLMDFKLSWLPSPLGGLMNRFRLLFLRTYVDKEFNEKTFMEGTNQAIPEIEANYNKMNDDEQKSIVVKEDLLLAAFIQSIDLYPSKSIEGGFSVDVTITYCMELAEFFFMTPKNYCNYKFQRNFRKDNSDDWIILKLN